MMFRQIESQGPRNSLTAEEAERLFAQVDNSGHANEASAESQRKRRLRTGHGVAVDPLAEEDPSGSNIGRIIEHAALILAVVVAGAFFAVQLYVSNTRSNNTANLSSNVSVRTVADALSGGVEWGGGFTQFPQDFSVQEADEHTGRIEVSVVDTTSQNALLCFSNAQIQATAFSTNSLLNPNINTVIYHVNVHQDDDGNIQRTSYFGFLRPTGNVVPFMTFVWTKSTNSQGQIRFHCAISGVDDELQEVLRNQILGQDNAPEDEDPYAREDAANGADNAEIAYEVED